jgi:hypothetical protein
MSAAVKTYNIDRGLLFIDACRDSPRVARLLNLVGDQPLKPNPYPRRRPDALIRLQSTASGLKSYQAKQDPGTIFTQALLEGLSGPPPTYLPYDTRSIPWQLLFAALEAHVKRKVINLLADHSPLAVQSVEPYGNPYNGLMLVARKVASLAPPAPAEIHAPTVTIQEAVEESAARILGAARLFGAGKIDAVRADAARIGLLSPAGDLANPYIMHTVFQHESITGPWIRSLSYLDAHSGAPAAAESVRIVGAYSQEIDTRVAAWIDMAVAPKPGGALWIGAADRSGRQASSAVVIAQDRYYPTPARLDVVFERREGHWALLAMSARLCDPAKLGDPGAAFVWTPVWDAQRTEALADLASAGRMIEQRLNLRSVVDDKSESPVAAAFAVNYLLRSGDLDYLQDWPRNLANWFEWLPDGAILWAETLLRRREIQMGAAPDVSAVTAKDRARILQGFLVEPGAFEALRYFVKLAERGVPLLASSLVLALQQAAVWREVQKAGIFPPPDASRLAQALDNVERARRYAVSGGGFARFVSVDGTLTPQLVFGARERLAARMAGAVAGA